jgi:precorrin-6A/cobalt-precorrin-6A reductase
VGAPVNVLVLGGSTEASSIARALVDDGFAVTTSFAGRTRERVQPAGSVRVGGFGGVDGLVQHLAKQHVELLVDATHPFARQMPHHARDACDATGVARVRVLRPPWQPVDGDTWHDVADLDGAAAAVQRLGARRVFLTTGRQELAPFARVPDVWFLVRAIEPPAGDLPPHSHVVLARGPFDDGDEYALMREHRVDLLVAKNSGGGATIAKLHAARRLHVPVVMVARPVQPPGLIAESVADARAWIAARFPIRGQAGYVRGV